MSEQDPTPLTADQTKMALRLAKMAAPLLGAQLRKLVPIPSDDAIWEEAQRAAMAACLLIDAAEICVTTKIVSRRSHPPEANAGIPVTEVSPAWRP